MVISLKVHSRNFGNPMVENEDPKMAFKADNLLLFTPILLKNHMKQVEIPYIYVVFSARRT